MTRTSGTTGRKVSPMAREPDSVLRTAELPARPNLEHLKNEAKARLKELRAVAPEAKLAQAQLDVARRYGFASWRALKLHVDALNPPPAERKRVFDAARRGDVEAVRSALDAGFDQALTDEDG